MSQDDGAELQKRRDFLISYTSQDQPWAEWIAEQLDAAGYTFFFQAWDFRPGSNFVAEMDNATKLADRTLLVLSAAYLASGFAFSEWAAALRHDPRGSERRLLPVRIEICDVSGLLAQIGYLDLVGSDAKQAKERLLQGIQKERVRPAHVAFPGSHAGATPFPAALPTLWNIPFARNLCFTGREDHLEWLHTQLHTMHTVVINGLGGIGKTQLAIEYAYRHSRKYQAVLWARAETMKALNASYTEIARVLALPLQDVQEQDMIVQAVRAWLESREGWLLLLDNVDDPTIVRPFLPARSPGHLLLTTRTQMTVRFAKRLEIDILDAQTGALLLLRRAGLIEPDALFATAAPSDQSLALALTEALGGLPLALDQAGAYIEETGCSLASYQLQYQARQAILLARRGIQLDDHPEPVTNTWSLSFRKVEEQNPTAVALLRTCAFVAPDAIPEALLEEALQTPLPVAKEAEAGCETEDGFSPPGSGHLDEAIALLRAYSLVRRSPQNQTLSIHQLVQMVVRESMSEAERRVWIQRTLRAVQKKLPEITFANWQQCEQYVPHARACVRLAAGNMGEVEARVTYWVGAYLLDRQRTQEAGRYVQQALKLYEENLGNDHPETAASLDRVAKWREKQGRLADAEPLYLRALSIHEQRSGPEHPLTATSLNNLAGLYYQQGRLADAEPLYQRALAISERQLGSEHPSTATSLKDLATLYQAQGRFEEAEPLYLRALSIREQQLGPEHPSTATCLNHLAALYQAQGRFGEAEPLYLRALLIREQQLGTEHPFTARSLNNLAGLYYQQGRLADAEPLYLRSLAIYEQQLGPEHSSTASSLNNLAALYRAQGRLADAEPLYQRALAVSEQRLGPTHPDTARSMNNLAALYQTQGRFADAEPLYQRALTIEEQRLGPEHPFTATCLNNLAALYRAQSRFADAEPLYQRTLAISEQRLGPEHPSTATCLNNLADLYCQQGRFADAEPLYQRALAISEQQRGPEHPSTASSLNNLAALYRAQGRLADAEPLYQRALAVSERVLGSLHPDTQAIRANYTSLLKAMKRMKTFRPKWLRWL
jgi:tetratricopeptide (TPR) repeat protein